MKEKSAVFTDKRIVAVFDLLQRQRVFNVLNPAMRSARIVMFALFPALAAGQSVSPTMSDATILPAGSLRFLGGVEWSRFDRVFGPGGKTTLPLGSLLTADVDASVLPLLQQAQIAAQALTGASALQLNLGTLTTTADSRIATVPILLEYGLSRRITVGIRVPIVDARTVVTTQLNGRKDSSANIGVNPAGFTLSPAAFAANSQVASGLATALAQIQLMIQTCTQSPGSPGCPAFNARLSEAKALVSDASAFSIAATELYGVSPSQPGAPFVPMAGGAIQAGVDAHLAAIRAEFTSFNINGGSGFLVGAKGFAANNELRAVTMGTQYGIGLDSIATTEQLSIGDIELSVATQAFNSFSDSAHGPFELRGTVAGVVRLGTGQVARVNRAFDIGTGDGQTDIEVRGAMDVLYRSRLLTTLAGTYTQQLGSVAYSRLPYAPDFVLILDSPVPGSIKPGNMAAFSMNPRWLITPGLMVGGLYSFSHRGGDQVTVTGFAPTGTVFGNTDPLNTWSGGATLSYSNLATRSGTGDPTFPAEFLFTHLETLGATASGANKTFRDTIELRLYFRTRR